jgi:TonB family protein
MERQYPEDQAALRSELREARLRVDRLVASLHEVDQTLESLTAEGSKFRLLETACNALYELETLGGAGLFWGGREGAGQGSDQLRIARSRLDGYEKQVALVEERRQVLLEEIEREQIDADVVAGFILDAERIEEERLSEWRVERELEALPIRPSLMPWASGREDDRRFRRTLLVALLLSLVLGVVLPLIDIPLPERWTILEEQERLTQLVREAVPAPPVVMAEEQPVEPVVPDESAPVEEESDAPVVAEKAQKESNPAPAASPATGKEAGPSSGSRGILAFREKFSGIAATNDAVDRLGSNATIHDPNAATDGLPERSLVTSSAPGASGGINVAALSRGTGGTGTALSGVAVARATSTLGTGNGNGGGGDGKGGARKVAGSGASLGRTDEEIQIVFDRHKAALYRLYNRELRQNPTLKGQIVLRLTIQPDGSVSSCEVKSSDMKAPQLAAQVVERVKGFDFGAKTGIAAVTIVYPIDFLPAT